MTKRASLTVTVRDAAAILGVTTQRVYQLVGDGDLAAIRQGWRVLIVATSLRTLAKKRSEKGGAR